MDGFAERIALADTLERTFIDSFNANCDGYKIIKYGIESTLLAQAHNYIRFCYDDTSKFVRYIPDSVIANVRNPRSNETTLIEFKAAKTGVRLVSFLESIKRECPNMTPPFGLKEDIFNIEKEALDFYMRLNTIGVKTIVVAYAHFRPDDSRLLCQCVDSIVVCNSYNPNRRGINVGSGTWISNVNLASFEKVTEFFNTRFGIERNIMEIVKNDVLQAFVQ